MLGLDLVRPLEAHWRESIDEVARTRRWPTTRDIAKLAASVKTLSERYNDPHRARASAETDGAARLGFFFARDVPKTAAAVRELVGTGLLRLERVVRILDVGAGMGASTWGIVRALEAAGGRGTVEATWVDPDRAALDVGAALARGREGTSPVTLRVHIASASVENLDASGSFDIVVASGLLSELDVGTEGPVRVERHAALLSEMLERHMPTTGSLVLVEPALRDRTRHLHAVRGALLARGLTVFAPCLHAASCPALERESDWCHDDIPIDLPPWLVPVARAAGLRHEGLTLAYLVLRRDAAHLLDGLTSPPSATRARVVSDAIRTKGKREVLLCGKFLTSSGGPATLSGARVRATRLDRDRTELNSAWEDLARGDLLVMDPPLRAPPARIERTTTVTSVDRNPRR
jgi:ribosomal protein RSM22 (predicted rRNA methylase)